MFSFHSNRSKTQDIYSRNNPSLYINEPRLLLTFSWLPPEFIRFALVGLSGVMVDLGVFYLLYKHSGLPLNFSTILSTEVAIINNFFLNDVWTFGNVPQEKSISQRFRRFLNFNLICVFGLILNGLIVNGLFYIFEINEYIAKLIAIACVSFWNFWLNIKLNWQINRNN